MGLSGGVGSSLLGKVLELSPLWNFCCLPEQLPFPPSAFFHLFEHSCFLWVTFKGPYRSGIVNATLKHGGRVEDAKQAGRWTVDAVTIVSSQVGDIENVPCVLKLLALILSQIQSGIKWFGLVFVS